MSERTGRPVRPIGQELNVANAQIRTLLDRQKEQILAECQAEIKVRISHGSNICVMNLNNNETEIPEDQLGEYALKLNAKDFACRTKAKAKPQRRELAGSSPRIVPIERRNWIDIEPGKYSFSEYEVSKKVTFLLRHSQQMHRDEDGAIHFWRIKENLQNQTPQSIHWSDDRWKACLAAGGGEKTNSSTVLMIPEQLFISELFKGHS